MINVIASIRIKDGCLGEFLQRFRANVPAVLAEQGCLEYAPTVDVDSGIEAQQKDPLIVTIIEKWDSLDALHAHLKAPHMLSYREGVKDLVDGVSLKVLAEA
jgi:quinol monooxygenase YgiN